MKPDVSQSLTRPHVISVPQAFNADELYVDLHSIFGRSLFLKCEGFNFAGSIKLKAATEMVEGAERRGLLTRQSVLVESSSGNLGVALSMLAASKGYRFVCVTDSRCNLSTRRLMQALGTQVHVVTEPDIENGLLGARLNYVRALCASDERYVWLNQYTNPGNWEAHYRKTAPADRTSLPRSGRAFRRSRNHGDPDGLRPLLPRVAPSGMDRGGRQLRFGDLRRSAGPPADSRPGHKRPSAAARRVLRRRGGSRRGGGHHPGVPPSRPERIPVRRLHRHGGQRGDEMVCPPRGRTISPRWPSPRTSVSATSTPSTSRTGCWMPTARTCSGPTRSTADCGASDRAELAGVGA